jgi:hypothetical protein
LEAIARSATPADTLHIITHNNILDRNDALVTQQQLEAFEKYEAVFAYPKGFEGKGQFSPTPIQSLANAAHFLVKAQQFIDAGDMSTAKSYIDYARQDLDKFKHDHKKRKYAL